MNELKFDPAIHEYRLGGRILPSVTQVLEPYYGLEFVDRVRLEAAQLFGSAVHEACHLVNLDLLDHDTLGTWVSAYTRGWERFLEESGFVVLASEQRVLHRKLGYAGTLDTVGMFPDKKKEVIIDIKTGASAPITVGPQTAAYNEARGRRVPRFCCLLQPHAYNLIPLTDIRDFDIFKCALTLHRWRTGQ